MVFDKQYLIRDRHVLRSEQEPGKAYHLSPVTFEAEAIHAVACSLNGMASHRGRKWPTISGARLRRRVMCAAPGTQRLNWAAAVSHSGPG
ncbi:hypothetical protein EVAR_91406_1 [Eumeta japonica]|uniref:Uncharacterized protein n=1 Tax=Eumeta variegata TaxID=151549 RepID=A0A4C1XBB2_EUMVA|nr:hypothetical protein EVAR_91406_1 [Eumeta japonica]